MEGGREGKGEGGKEGGREREGGRKEGERGRQEGGRERTQVKQSQYVSQDFSADQSATLTFDPTPHLAAPWAVQCGLELALEHAHHHTLVPLQVLVPGLLRHVLGGREGERREEGGGEGGERMEGGTEKGEGGEGRGRERVRGRGGAATEACKPCMYVYMYVHVHEERLGNIFREL